MQQQVLLGGAGYTFSGFLYFTRRVEGSKIGARQNTKGNAMGLMDYLKTQLLDIIQWEDDSRDTLSFRFPDEDKEIKRGAQLIVRESQVAVYLPGPVW